MPVALLKLLTCTRYPLLILMLPASSSQGTLAAAEEAEAGVIPLATYVDTNFHCSWQAAHTRAAAWHKALPCNMPHILTGAVSPKTADDW